MRVPAPSTASASALDDDAIARFRAIVGDGGVVVDDDAKAPYLAEQRGHFASASPLVLRPGTTAEVAAIVMLARAEGLAIVPQGGNTGLVGGHRRQW